jgi:hypothetical protein
MAGEKPVYLYTLSIDRRSKADVGNQHFTHDEKDLPFDRVRFDFADRHHLTYIDMRLLRRVGLAPDADAFITAERLGPDALDSSFDLAGAEGPKVPCRG